MKLPKTWDRKYREQCQMDHVISGFYITFHDILFRVEVSINAKEPIFKWSETIKLPAWLKLLQLFVPTCIQPLHILWKPSMAIWHSSSQKLIFEQSNEWKKKKKLYSDCTQSSAIMSKYVAVLFTKYLSSFSKKIKLTDIKYKYVDKSNARFTIN